MKSVRIVFLAAAVIFIAAATLTPGSATFPGGIRPDFWCFACGATGGADVSVNIALFVPFGFALGFFVRGTLTERLLKPVAAGFAFSVCIELLQRAGFPPSRVFNVTDIATNTFGTLLGAFVAGTAPQWLNPSRPLATRLAVGGIVAIAAVLLLTAWALSPLPSTQVARPLRTSRMPFTPGYGWYHGQVTHVTFNGVALRHEGDGPVILIGDRAKAYALSVQLSGRDERDGLVPFVYVHDESFIEPDLLLGQRGTSAQLSVRLRGSKLRLPQPAVFVRDAFSELGEDVNRTVTANISPKQWDLSVDDGLHVRRTSQRISLALGWTVLQTVVSLESRAAPFISAAWMFLPWIAIGYWSFFAAGATDAVTNRRGAERAMRAAAGGAHPHAMRIAAVGLVLPVLLLAIPRMMGIAETVLGEVLLALLGYVTGLSFAWFAPGITEWFRGLAPGSPPANPLR